jgi:hypothetical protein
VKKLYGFQVLRPETLVKTYFAKITLKERIFSFIDSLKMPILWGLWVLITVVNFYIFMGQM